MGEYEEECGLGLVTCVMLTARKAVETSRLERGAKKLSAYGR